MAPHITNLRWPLIWNPCFFLKFRPYHFARHFLGGIYILRIFERDHRLKFLDLLQMLGRSEPNIFPQMVFFSQKKTWWLMVYHGIPILGKKNTKNKHMDVSKNSGTPKSSILMVFSIINHPFWGIPILGNTHIQEFCVCLFLMKAWLPPWPWDLISMAKWSLDETWKS